MIRPPVLAVMACATLVVACQALPGADGPAQLVGPEAAARASLVEAAAVLLGRTRIELGAGPVIGVSSVSVLPPPPGPLETRSPAVPEQLSILLRDGQCVLLHPQTGRTVPLAGVRCEPA
jgi:hypothetical protein